MKKIVVLLLLSIMASTAAFASTSTTFSYGEGHMYTSSFGAYVDTISWVGPEKLVARVTVHYNLNGYSHDVSGSVTDERDSVSASATIPSGATPTYASGYHSITVSGLSTTFSGQTNYTW